MQLEKLKEAGDKKNDCVMRSRALSKHGQREIAATDAPCRPGAAGGRQQGRHWGRQPPIGTALVLGRGGHKVTIVRAAEGRQGASQGAAGGVRGAAPGVAGGVITSAGGAAVGAADVWVAAMQRPMRVAQFDVFEPPKSCTGGMLFETLAMLKQHELLSSDPEANKKIFGTGSVLLQILSGRIIFTPPSSFAALDAICGSIDVSTRRERRGSNYMQWQLQFDERHTSFDMSSRYALVLHHRVGSAVAGGTSAPAIRIEHDSKIISSATDLPPIGPWLEARRCSIALRQDILDPDGDDEPPRKRRASGTKKKKPTPPGVRRSTRARRQDSNSLTFMLES
ncbi:hypothetical protein C8F04DRAFT_1194996 [Mycena alexandri]|uniref:Uncharacterized protein n=1 Tax=Mycena alexandri TaxID=1745969 RepID=A0AAD6S7P8_9AGAR|nr:hypothetical protein C8F04DRAFT_1194996 [Mycena alexandri]